MAIYKINTTPVTITETNIISQNVAMVLETVSLLTGQVLDGTTPIEGAYVILVQTLVAAPNTVTEIASAVTDSNGNYGFPHDFDTVTYTYSVKVYTPNPIA